MQTNTGVLFIHITLLLRFIFAAAVFALRPWHDTKPTQMVTPILAIETRILAAKLRGGGIFTLRNRKTGEKVFFRGDHR